MAIFIPPKGTTEQLQTVVLQEGEIVFNSTNKKFYTGDNQTPGGIPIVENMDSITEELANKVDLTDFQETATVVENLATAVESKASAADLQAVQDDVDGKADLGDYQTTAGTIESLAAQVQFLQNRLDRMGDTERASTVSKVMVADPEAEPTVVNNPTQDVILEGATNVKSQITAKNIEVKNMDFALSGETPVAGGNEIYLVASEDVELKKSAVESNTSGKLHNVVKIMDAKSIVVRDMTFTGNVYNTIMTGQNEGSKPCAPVKYMLIENCDFAESCRHVSIWAASLDEDAVVTINNCHFASCEQVLCLSNFANAAGNRVTVNMTNCKIDNFESAADDKYSGIILCDDRMNTTEEAFLASKPFSKIIINLNNVEIKRNDEYVKLTEENFEMGCDEDFTNQMLYVYLAKAGKVYKYSEYPDVFPTVNIR